MTFSGYNDDIYYDVKGDRRITTDTDINGIWQLYAVIRQQLRVEMPKQMLVDGLAVKSVTRRSIDIAVSNDGHCSIVLHSLSGHVVKTIFNGYLKS